jgi:hypothetical protein
MNLIKKINYDDEGIYDVTYFNNGREINFEDYIKIENSLEEENEDDYNNYEDNGCDCYECTLDRYVARINEIAFGCPHCIREILEDFVGEVIDHVVVEE